MHAPQPPDRRDDGLRLLRRFASRKRTVETCELCSRIIAVEHQHLIEPPTRHLLCVCDGCAILFSGVTNPKLRRVPRDVRLLTRFFITDAQWESLRIPIEMAFFFHSSHTNRIVALYPSPAGPTESLLSLDSWKEIARDNPALSLMTPDVEALVVNRIGTPRSGVTDGTTPETLREPEYFLLPIDECFHLVGLIRMHWKGFSGGTDVWREIDAFFTEMRRRARHVPEAPREDVPHA
jgi:hypothetical protein